PEAPPAPPAQPPGLLGKITAYFLREINLANLQVDDGEIVITDGGSTRRFPNLYLKSSLTLYSFGQPQQQARINIASLRLTTPQGRAELETRLRYGAGLATIDSLNLKLAGQTVLSLEGEVCRPLTGLTCSLTGKIGPLEGAKIHGLWPQWPAPWDLSGGFFLTSTPEAGQIRLQGRIGQATVEVKGDLDAKAKPAAFELEMNLKGLTTAQLKEINNPAVQKIQGLSPVNARLHLKGAGLPWNPESLATSLTLEPFRYKELKVEKARLDLSGNARQQDLKASAEGNFGGLALTAAGRLLPLGEGGPGLHGDLTLQTREFQPGLVGVSKLAGSNLTTCFTGKFRLPDNLSPAHLYLAGNLEASGRVNKQPLQNLTAGFVLEGRKLTLSRADVQMAGLAASVKGTLTESTMDVAFTASVANSRLVPLPPGAAFASLTAEGAARGPWKSPQVTLAATARNLSVQGVTLESANLNAALAGWPPQSGTLKLLGSQMKTPAGTFTRLHLEASGSNGQWQFQAAATSPKEPNFELAGTADLAARPLAFNLARVNWRSQTLTLKNQAPFQVHLLPGWEISTATFQVDGGVVTIAGLARGQEVSGRLDVKNVNAALLAPLSFPATGSLSGQLSLAGTPSNPVINGQLALSAGRVQNIPIQVFTTTLNYQAARMLVSGYLEAGPQRSRLVWQGSVPVQLSLAPIRFALGNEGLNLRVQSENVNLGLLTIFSKEVMSAAGPVTAQVEAKGDPHKPLISGFIRWGEGSLRLRQAGATYTLEPGEIRLLGDKITIPGIILASDGTIRLSGEVTLAGVPAAVVQGRSDNFLLMDRGGNNLWVNGFVDLRGPLSALVAKGRLTVPKAQFRPTFFQSGQDPDVVLVRHQPRAQEQPAAAPALYRNMQIDVSIEAPGNVWLKDPVGKMELAANLTARKAPGSKLVMGGQIRSLQGTINIEDRPFKVERGTLTLPGIPNKPILVDLKADHPMDDITLILAINGTVTNPIIHMESLPPLPPADVLSYLVFGAPAATLTRDQYLALGAQQLGVLGGISTAKLSEILGSTIPLLSGIKVKTGMVSGRPTVGLQKEVTKNVSIFVGRNLNEERGTYEQQAGIEYKINKNWSVESQIGTRNSGADVYFNYDF
ncbi:MAG: translocation/assembly module TamB domain-containing protein, partial [Syntrophobacterales bacterium]|nr:translocation/assembly module TamB domain-containing protein [Syntrophobacterales bacterium]